MTNRSRKLQVFVSSTFIDLQEERQAAVQAILKVGHIPAGMELFKAGDEEQWEIIKTWIEESDVYMLILGGRYGSIELKSGKSYTQLEYEYALELNKPFFAIIVNDALTNKKAKKKGVNIGDFIEVHNLQKLNEFRATVKTKMVSFAEDLKDIRLAVSDSLHEINKRENLQGWVKADNTDFSSISEELARLSKENSELKLELANYQNSGEKINGIDIKEFALLLKKKKVGGLTFQYNDRDEYKDIKNLLSFFQYFSIEKKEQNGGFVDEYDDYSNSLRNIRNYELVEKDSLYFTQTGTKLMVYLEMNPQLLE